MTMLGIDPPRTALVVIDLQVRIVGQQTGPATGADVVRRAMRLADAVRDAGGLVVVVRAERPGVAEQPPGSELVDEVSPRPGDLMIVKRALSAFHGTDLHEKLRGEGIGTVVLCGLMTNFGVESTARTASDHGYSVVLPQDAMAGFTAAEHRFAIESIFPKLGTVCVTDDVLAAFVRPAGKEPPG